MHSAGTRLKDSHLNVGQVLSKAHDSVCGSSFIYCDTASTNVAGEKKGAVAIGHHCSFVVESALMSYFK